MKKLFFFLLFYSFFTVNAQNLNTTYSEVPYISGISDLETPLAIDVEKISADSYLEIASAAYRDGYSTGWYSGFVEFSLNNGSGSYNSYTTVNYQGDND
jgi:hypothetical protein